MPVDVSLRPNVIVTVKNIDDNDFILHYIARVSGNEEERSIVLEPQDSAKVTVTPRQFITLSALAGDETPPIELIVSAPIERAMSGDLVLELSPEEVGQSAAALANGGTRRVIITLKTVSGEIHDWYSAELAVAVTTDSTAGTVSIDSATPMMIGGECVVDIIYDEAAWAAGETVTLTVDAQTIMGYTVTGGTSVDTITE
jgi:hypothetical protein